jgi:hypothetical protein
MSDFGSRFRLTLITDDVHLAADADRAGVDRIGVDLETLGKAERQAGHDTRLSRHNLADLARMAGTLRHARAFARINPPHAGTADEIEAVLHAGATVIMLPYFHAVDEAEAFIAGVAGRAETILLVETPGALKAMPRLVTLHGVDEIMAGLNDLRLSLGLASHFEVLTSRTMDVMAGQARAAGIRFSAGGVARPARHDLPADADLVLAQYPRLMATGAWLSRSFFAAWPENLTLAEGVAEIREGLTRWSLASDEALETARQTLRSRLLS